MKKIQAFGFFFFADAEVFDNRSLFRGKETADLLVGVRRFSLCVYLFVGVISLCGEMVFPVFSSMIFGSSSGR